MTVIRAVESPADLAAARALVAEYVAGLGVDLAYQEVATELATLPGAYVPPAGAFLIADLDGELVGCVALRVFQPLVAEMKRLYVRPSGRGRGIGAALTQAILESARAAGYASVRLDTLPGMTEAQSLYRSMGFREIPPYRHSPVEGTVFMEIALDTLPRG